MKREIIQVFLPFFRAQDRVAQQTIYYATILFPPISIVSLVLIRILIMRSVLWELDIVK
jgi:hypothetical protein